MEIYGLTHPIPTNFAKRIYENNKNVYVGKSYRNKVNKGDKFIIYESHGAKAYTGWATIKFIGKMKTKDILKKYNNKLIVTEEEFKEYSKDKSHMNVIEFENFERFLIPIKPKHFVTVSGKYIGRQEFEMIKKNKQ